MASVVSAKVADGMTGQERRSNMELVAQGIANVASALLGGISVTGTIARTAINIQAGRAQPRRGHDARRVLAGLHARRRAFGEFYPALDARWRACRRLVKYAGKGRVPRPVAHGARRDHIDRHLRPHAAEGSLTVGIVAGCVVAALFVAIDRLRPRTND